MKNFENLVELPPDPLFGVQKAFEEDSNPNKVNLSVGTYKTEELKAYILPCVKKAERFLLENQTSKDYLPITGLPNYVEATQKLVFADAGSSIFGAQTVGGTSALRLAGNFLIKAGFTTIYMSDPTWGNHPHIFKEAGFEIKRYDYFAGLEPFAEMEEGSVVLLQPCCHNPTGCDYTSDQWSQLAQVLEKRSLFPLFDMAYQGFGEGLDADAAVLRQFAQQGRPMMAAISHSKNFGLYRERVGALFMQHQDVKRLHSQLRMTIRGLYSNPPAHGAEIVAHILSTPDLKGQWQEELEQMRQRISSMRQALVQQLPNRQFMLDQRGMFSFTRLTPDQVMRLRQEFGIYMTKDGRINVAGLNQKNVGYVSKAILSLDA